MKQHELKTINPHFGFVFCGQKTFELRKDDRGFSVGDTLILKEWDEINKSYSGAEVRAEITHILEGGEYGLLHGNVILSLGNVKTYPGTTFA